MKELIPFVEQNGQKMVSAKILHQFLGCRKHFSDWFKHRIQKYKLEPGVDFMPIASLPGDAKRSSHNAVDYALTITCAKELSMVEANEKGKQARQYFITKEQHFNMLQDGLAGMLQETQRRLAELEQRMQLALPESQVFSIMGYARLYHHALHLQEAIKLGKKARKLSEERGVSIGLVSDPRFGKVNTYHQDILKEVFEEAFPLL